MDGYTSTLLGELCKESSRKFANEAVLLCTTLSCSYLVGVALFQHLDSDRGVLSAVDNVGGGGLHDLAEGALAKRLCPVHQSISHPSLVKLYVGDPKNKCEFSRVG